MLAILKKELRTYFNSMIGYLFIFFFVLIMGMFYYFGNVLSGDPSFGHVLYSMTIILLILIPTITMRLFSEEMKQRTDQLLFTSPLTIRDIVLGKYFAAVCLFLITMIITIIFPLMIAPYGKLPVAEIFGTYVGFILLASCFIAVGIFVSALTDNQIISAVGSFALLFLIYIMDGVSKLFPSDRVSSFVFVAIVIFAFAMLLYNSTKNIVIPICVSVIAVIATIATFFVNNFFFDGIIVKVFSWISVVSRFNSFSSGVFSLTDGVYCITFSIIFLYLTINVIEKRRWS